jgi:hypothetical protein
MDTRILQWTDSHAGHLQSFLKTETGQVLKSIIKSYRPDISTSGVMDMQVYALTAAKFDEYQILTNLIKHHSDPNNFKVPFSTSNYVDESLADVK